MLKVQQYLESKQNKTIWPSIQIALIWQQVLTPSQSETTCLIMIWQIGSFSFPVTIRRPKSLRICRQLFASVHTSLNLAVGKFMRNFSTSFEWCCFLRTNNVQVLVFGHGSTISSKASSFTTKGLPGLGLSPRLLLHSLKHLNQLIVPGPSTSLIYFAAALSLGPFFHR